jgi:hypothetical protein
MKSINAQILLLAVALVAVVYSIFSLKGGGVSLSAILGGSSPHHFNLCPTRVSEIQEQSHYGQVAIAQDGRHWKRLQPKVQDIENTQMEIWLGRYCQLKLDESLDSETARREFVKEPLSQIRITYIDGTQKLIQRHPRGVYQENEKYFRSNTFDVALAELATLN